MRQPVAATTLFVALPGSGVPGSAGPRSPQEGETHVSKAKCLVSL